MNIKERMERQMLNAGIARVTTVASVPCPSGPCSVPDRIGKQLNRVKVDAAIAATKTPPPDYVYKEPRMPRQRPTEETVVKNFLEDRIYDDIPMEKSKLDPSRITSLADINRVIISEQPREFVVSKEEQARHGSPGFGDIGMDALEGNGYADLKRDRSADSAERVMDAPSEPTQLPFSAIKIDLSGGFGNVKELTPQDNAGTAPQVAPQVAQQVGPPPMEEAMGKGDNPVEMNSVQKQMLAAMRAQRKALNL